MQKHKVDKVIHTAGLIGGKVAQAALQRFADQCHGNDQRGGSRSAHGVNGWCKLAPWVFMIAGWRATVHRGEFPSRTRRAYGNSKVAKELMVEAYQRLYGFELIIVRLANVYGVGHFAGGSGGGEMVQNLLQNRIKGGVVKINQEQARDFEYIYYKDLGRALDKVATVGLSAPTTLNIGTGVIVTFDDLVGTAEKLLPKLQVEIIPGTKPRSPNNPW